MKGVISVGTMMLIAGIFTIGSISLLFLHKSKLEVGIENYYKLNKVEAALYTLLNSKTNEKTTFEQISEYEVGGLQDVKEKLEKIFDTDCFKLMLGDIVLAQSEKTCEFKYQASFIIPLPGNRVEKIRLLI